MDSPPSAASIPRPPIRRGARHATHASGRRNGQAAEFDGPLTQRRQLQRKHIEPVIEVCPEFFLADAATEVAVRGGDHPHIGADGLIAAYALELPLLQHAQQFDLHVRWHFTDLVEKNGARMGELETPHAPLDGPAERAAFVSKELAFDQADRKSGAIHLDERLVGPLAGGVDRACDQLLAGPLSPVISTVASVGATRRTFSRTFTRPALAPTISSKCGPP